jgi:secreted trypsin-like serine protease
VTFHRAISARLALGFSLCQLLGCGAPQAPEAVARSTSPVIGGAPIGESDYPATGALVEWLPSSSPSPTLVCTATLVGPRILLTAAHCVAGNDVSDWRFSIAAQVQNASPATAVKVLRAYIHPSFDPLAATALHDIALVELDSSPAAATPDPLLASADAASALNPGDGVELIGYGQQTADGGVVGTKNAAAGVISAVSADEFVVGGPGAVQNCVGDSGGPSYAIGVDGSRRMIGITSRSANDMSACVDGSIHTRLDAFEGWLAMTVGSIAAAEQPQSNACSVGSWSGREDQRGDLSCLLVAAFALPAVVRRRRSVGKRQQSRRPRWLPFQ